VKSREIKRNQEKSKEIEGNPLIGSEYVGMHGA